MESFSTENRVVYTDLSINAKVFVPVDKLQKTSPKLSVNAKEYFPLTDNSNIKEPVSRFTKNPYKNMK
jgi:hypothetical protein